jgi:hypothetical protein
VTLREIINEIENTSDDLVIFATRKNGAWDVNGPVAMVLLSDMDNIGTDLEGLHYFLEIELAKEVLDVWKQWTGRTPTEKERDEALIYYADNDAYLDA